MPGARRSGSSGLTALRFALLLLVGSFASASVAQPLTPVEPSDRSAMRAALRDLCHREVAVLGEATHADGHTESFKVALIERLVRRCGFRAVIFEGSLYEFLGFARARREGRASETMVGNAIGGLWKFETEVMPLTRFLYARAMAGQITLGGMDNQLGGLDQPFANDAMPKILTRRLPAERAAPCLTALDRRISWRFDDANPNSDAFKSFARTCVAEIRATLRQEGMADRERSDLTVMLDGVERQLRRDSLSRAEYTKDRDRSMYGEFARFAAGLSEGTRIIVWTHNLHAAKSPVVWPDLDGAPTFGTLLHQAYGQRAFALAFSARGGSYRWSRKEDRAIPVPPSGALERAATNAETAYVGSAALQASGVSPAAIDNHNYRVRPWGEAYDGLVVFAQERPPHSTRALPQR